MPNHAEMMSKELDAITSTSGFCADWKTKWRSLAVSVQGFLNLVFPAGAKVVGFLISIADSFCGTSTATGN